MHDKDRVCLDLSVVPTLSWGLCESSESGDSGPAKSARLAYSDRIVVSLSKSDTADKVLRRYQAWLAKQTLQKKYE